MEAGIYEHYEGGLYWYVGLSEHTETHERTHVYLSLTGAHMPGPRLRNRPADMFEEPVPWPDGTLKPRFIHIGDELPQDMLERYKHAGWLGRKKEKERYEQSKG